MAIYLIVLLGNWKYSRYDMDLFSEEQRKERHETQFPFDLKNACHLGSRLAQRAKGAGA